MLRMEKEILKNESVLREGNEVKYGFIREYPGHWPVAHLCCLLGVLRSAYNDWRNKTCKVIPPEELELPQHMIELLRVSATIWAVARW